MGKKVTCQFEWHLYDDELAEIDEVWTMVNQITRNIYSENGEFDFQIVKVEEEDDSDA